MKIKDRKTTVTLSNNVWKMLQMKKIEGNYRTLEDVIYSMLIKEEAKGGKRKNEIRRT